MREDVREYYGQTLQGSSDLQTNACCDQVAPQSLRGMRVLDLGCGTFLLLRAGYAIDSY